MRRGRAIGILLLWGGVGLSCHVQTAGSVRSGSTTPNQVAPPAPVEDSAPTPVEVEAPQLDTGVTSIETDCSSTEAEQCNGLDDNCNGQIDEGCGYSSGAIQITLAWGSGADIDLYVTDPAGETLSYSHRDVSSGGQLDHDARGQCRPDQSHTNIENVYWQSARPHAGTYAIRLHYWGECNSNAGPTTTTVSVAVGGRVIGAYQYTLAPQQSVTIATFKLP